MKLGKIIIVGIGPGSKEDITPAAFQAVKTADIVVGYKFYFQFVEDYIRKDAQCIDTGMKQERQRARQAFEYALKGNTVCVISSGDAGIYGMAPLLFEMQKEFEQEIEIEVVPGISAFQKAAALLGAPIGHDFCIVSMSDLLTPWEKIERRIFAAAQGDFVTAIFNPKSKGRYWQLHRLKEIFQQECDEDRVVGIVRQAGREDEKITLTTLKDFDPDVADMFTMIIIGNSQTQILKNRMLTPRGYYQNSKEDGIKVGQSIMIESFRTINSELKNPNIPLGKKWAMLHAIHTTADFEMENIIYTDENAVENLFKAVQEKKLTTVITDVTMVKAGVRKGTLDRLGVEVKCYLHDPRVPELAEKEGITRTQAGIRLATKEHPDALYAFGNAPTALIELCNIIRKGKIKPAGIIAAPVGFVNVKESKHQAKTFKDIPKIIVEGRKGGSNLAATLVNTVLTFDDAVHLRPGKDM